MFGCWGKRLAEGLHIKTLRMSRSLKVGTGFSLAIFATKSVHADEAKDNVMQLRDNGGAPLDLSQIPQQSSHTFLLSQSSVLCIEAASRTLHHSVVALVEIASSYSAHLSELAALLELGGDGLPLAYTSSEIYDKMVELRMDLKREKQQLAELNLLFTCCRRVLENAGETAFLVGADFSACRKQRENTLKGQAKQRRQEARKSLKRQSRSQKFPSLQLLCLLHLNHMRSPKSQHMRS